MSRGHRRRLIIWAVLRTVATIGAVVAIYYLAPTDHTIDAATIVGMALAGFALGAVLVFQLWRISRADYPNLRAVESLAFTIPVYLLFFATVYFLMSHASGEAFGSALSRTDAVYFSSVVLSTVGFGDIAPKTEAARLVLTAQIMLDLVIVGLVVRLVLNAVKRGQQRNAPAPPAGDPG